MNNKFSSLPSSTVFLFSAIFVCLLLNQKCVKCANDDNLAGGRVKRQEQLGAAIGAGLDMSLTIVETFQKGAAVRGSSQTDIEIFGQKASHNKDLETGFGDAIARPDERRRKRRSPRGKHGCRRSSTTETPETPEIVDRKRRSASAELLAPGGTLNRAAREAAAEYIDYDNVMPNNVQNNEPLNFFQSALETCVRIVKRTISWLKNNGQPTAAAAGGEDYVLN